MGVAGGGLIASGYMLEGLVSGWVGKNMPVSVIASLMFAQGHACAYMAVMCANIPRFASVHWGKLSGALQVNGCARSGVVAARRRSHCSRRGEAWNDEDEDEAEAAQRWQVVVVFAVIVALRHRRGKPWMWRDVSMAGRSRKSGSPPRSLVRISRRVVAAAVYAAAGASSLAVAQAALRSSRRARIAWRSANRVPCLL